MSTNWGCETLFEPLVADLVFVHGLGGHRKDTWTKDGVCWPKELLPKEEALSRVRVLTFGYDADPVGHVSLNSLFGHSINLLNELSRERRQDAQGRPIIFIAHSFGGLIVKDALALSEDVKDTQPHLAQIVSATRGIIFLGTPHRGSSIMSLADLVAIVSGVALPRTLFQDLWGNSHVLDRIRDGFRRLLDKRTITIWSFVEELPMMGLGKVVYGESAIIGDARENRESIHADHVNMTKFSTRDDAEYRKVTYAIEMLLETQGKQSVRYPNISISGVGQLVQTGSITAGAESSNGGHGGSMFVGSRTAFDPLAPQFTSDALHNSRGPSEHNFHNSNPSTAVEPDVLHDLFGDISFIHLTNALDYELENLLWSIRVSLGDVRSRAIRTSPKRAEALIHILNDYRYDTALTNAFRDYVLLSTGLLYLLTDQAKAEATRRRLQVIEPRRLTALGTHETSAAVGTLSRGGEYPAVHSNRATGVRVEITLKNLGSDIITFSCVATDGE